MLVMVVIFVVFVLMVEHLIVVFCDLLRQVQLFVDFVQVGDLHIIVFFSSSICVGQPRLFFMIGVIAVFHVSQLVVHITEQLVKLAVVGQA